MLKKMLPPKKLQALLNPTSRPCLTISVPGQESFLSPVERKAFFRLQVQEAEGILEKDYGQTYANIFIDHFCKSNPESIFDESVGGLIFYYNQHVNEVIELPISILPQSVVADSFYLKPLFRYFQTTTNFKLVSLGEGRVSVFEGNPWGINFIKSYPLDPQGSYKSLYETVSWDLEIYNDERKSVVILMGPEWKQELFHSLNLVPMLFRSDYFDEVKMDHLEEVKESAFAMIRRMYNKTKQKIINEFKTSATQNNVLTDLKTISKGIHLGVVNKLLIASDQVVWGEIGSDGRHLKLYSQQSNSKDNDVLSQLAERLISQGGKVLCLPRSEMPNHALALAFV